MCKRNIVLESIRKSKRWVVILLFLFFVVLHCYSQSYQVHHYSGADGLANAHVFDITQDRWGRMWFATRGGISCYDGVDWKNYTMADGLPAQSFVKISVDRKGRTAAQHLHGIKSKRWKSIFLITKR